MKSKQHSQRPHPKPQSSEPAYQVGPGTWVELSYSVYDADETCVEGPGARHAFVFGMGQLLPKLEQAIDGARPGDKARVKLKAADAYGKREPDKVLEVDRAEFPADVAPGDRFEAERDDGGMVVLQVLDVSEEVVVIDGNHPLAGQAVTFELTVDSVRPATGEEVEALEKRLQTSVEVAPPSHEPLIVPQRLLRGPRKDYEENSSSSGDSSKAKPSKPS